MPSFPDYLAAKAMEHENAMRSWQSMDPTKVLPDLASREFIPYNTSHPNPSGLVEAMTVYPWLQSGTFALGWVYLCVILATFAAALRFYHIWTDKVRAGLYKQEMLKTFGDELEYEMTALPTQPSTATSTTRLYPWDKAPPGVPKDQSNVSSLRPFNLVVTWFRYFFYRSLPAIGKGSRAFVLPSVPVIFIVVASVVFVLLYCFIPRPYYESNLRFGSPPLAVRAGMLAVSTIPWTIALSMKANLLTLFTGISHEKLNILHRWTAYMCLLLSLIHTIPFYIQTPQDPVGYTIFQGYFGPTGVWLYKTGWAALGPLIFLCLHSLPFVRRLMYSLFVILHVPASVIFFAMVFWHTRNYLTSWHYLYVTLIFWLGSYILAIFYLNWTNPMRDSWIIGDEAAITAMAEGAAKVTIPTMVRWRPGQYVYLRMPGISLFDNHPCTITSICSKDLPSDYGEAHRDMVLVFRPQEKFTKKLLAKLERKGEWETYRAFLDGPYGGSVRHLESFDNVVFIAGGSGLSAIVSQLINLIKLQRDGKAVTKSIQLIMAMKKPESMEWFKEEIRTCQEFCIPGTLQCFFYITAAKPSDSTGQLVSAQTPSRVLSTQFHDKVNDMFQGIAQNRWTYEEPDGHHDEKMDEDTQNGSSEPNHEDENGHGGTPPAPPNLFPKRTDSLGAMGKPTLHEKRRPGPQLSLSIPNPAQTKPLGVPQTPAQFQQTVMQFASLPADVRAEQSWRTDYGRPDLPGLLKELSQGFGKRACVYVAGPPSMRVDVANTVAKLQMTVVKDSYRDEVYLYSESHAGSM